MELLVHDTRRGDREPGAREAYYVSDFGVGRVWRLEDGDGDGDALDTAEKLLWADGFTRIAELAVDGSSLLAIEEGMADGTNQIVRLTDINGDGDALDLGERIVWADELDDPRSIADDGNGNWYVTETDDNLVWRMVDGNGDGDALDLGDVSLFADGFDTPVDIVAVNVLSADVDQDGDVDGADFLALQRTNPALIPLWETEYPGAPGLAASQAVPEPANFALAVLSMCLFLGRHTRT